ncbi:MAG: peptidoglycan DD-metalloendopeptidase family protein [Ignavibacteriaceae bacterium]|nr:peptidoglycan DD-metalloendopeptidase family protein [Ignavibacteriaceae bacterium]MCU0364149.1 peptidoglycan DD-metalloendopeptidase family protein [Ignavibacteriaceae bacterium]MCU0405440.1 peptidoglycan DD-metalloendopeptidase family protein [Ignavibacteriaceae bacterium]
MKTEKNTTIFLRLSYLLIGITFLSILIWGWIKCSDSSEIPEALAQEPQLNSFGFYSDSLEHKIHSVSKNETLSDILLKLGVPAGDIMQIVDNAKRVIDVRKIVTGNLYHAFTNNDSLNTLVYFVYEKSPRHFVVFDLRDSINVYESEKEVVVRENQKSAVIDQSLYVSLLNTDATPELAIKLSEIFAWQIDFYHLQKGDNFKVIYEELFVDNNFFAIGKIKAAYFNHRGKDFYAIPFTQDSVFQYFDENGNSLRKAFLKAPLEFGRISSRYSNSRLHPVLKTRRPHHGVDYAAPIGTPVRTTGDGVVVEAGYNGGSGRFIKIRHNSVYTTMYLHLSRYAKGIKKGTSVQQGQVIGYVGSSGLSTGPHLDYRFFVNGSPVDPLKVEVPPSHPVKQELRAEYEVQREIVLKLLDKVEITLSENPV